MKWTKNEIDYLRENYPKNTPLNEIAKEIKKSIRALQHKAARIEVSRPRFPSDKPSNRTPRNLIDKQYYEKNREKIYKRKTERLSKLREELKKMLGGKCDKCGYDKCSSALDFHHNMSGKEGNISHLIKDFSKEKSLKEIKKCILLCANCHRELHHYTGVSR